MYGSLVTNGYSLTTTLRVIIPGVPVASLAC
jgi:hypothetical protein